MSIEQPIGYASVEERKAVGAHYTPRILADFVARKMLESWKPAPEVTSVRLLDPAVGDGELLLSLLDKIHRAGFSEVQCIGFDTDRQALDLASTRISASHPHIVSRLRVGGLVLPQRPQRPQRKFQTIEKLGVLCVLCGKK